MSRELPEFVAIGHVERAHGIRGDVRVRPLTDHPERFKQIKRVFIEHPQGATDEYELTKVVVHEHVIYLGLRGITTREQAQILKGATLKIRREECLPVGDDEYYHFELVGAEVRTTAGVHLGRVESVWELPANDVIVVRNDDREWLIPVIKPVIKNVDVEKGEIVIEPLEGLLE